MDQLEAVRLDQRHNPVEPRADVCRHSFQLSDDGADGIVENGTAPIDTSLVTGESLPTTVAPGSAVFAGTLNLGETLTIKATAGGDTTVLAECVRLIEAAEASRSRFVILADRVARLYAPAVHAAALVTFLWW